MVNNSIVFDILENSEDEVGKKLNILIRPENIKISANNIKDSILGIVKDIIYDGAVTKLFVDIDDKLSLKVNVHGNIHIKEEDQVYLKIEKDSIIPIRRNNYEKR